LIYIECNGAVFNICHSSKLYSKLSGIFVRNVKTSIKKCASDQKLRDKMKQIFKASNRIHSLSDIVIFTSTEFTAVMQPKCSSTFVMLPPLSSTETQTNRTIKYVYCYENELANRSIMKDNIKQRERDNAENENENEYEVLLRRRLNPRSKEDFKNLHEDIEKWRDVKLKELDNDQEKMTKENRAEFGQRIFDDELKLLQKVGSLRTAGRKNYSKQKVQRYLENMSNDIVWEINSGEKIRVEFSSKLYASKLARMYMTLGDFANQEGMDFAYFVISKSFALSPTYYICSHMLQYYK